MRCGVYYIHIEDLKNEDETVNYGRDDGDDIHTGSWIVFDKDYPNKPPSIRFISQITRTCVNMESSMV